MTGRAGKWHRLTPCDTNVRYCTLGQHFFGGSGWAYVEDRNVLVQLHTTCDDCASQAGKQMDQLVAR